MLKLPHPPAIDLKKRHRKMAVQGFGKTKKLTLKKACFGVVYINAICIQDCIQQGFEIK